MVSLDTTKLPADIGATRCFEPKEEVTSTSLRQSALLQSEHLLESKPAFEKLNLDQQTKAMAIFYALNSNTDRSTPNRSPSANADLLEKLLTLKTPDGSDQIINLKYNGTNILDGLNTIACSKMDADLLKYHGVTSCQVLNQLVNSIVNINSGKNINQDLLNAVNKLNNSATGQARSEAAGTVGTASGTFNAAGQLLNKGGNLFQGPGSAAPAPEMPTGGTSLQGYSSPGGSAPGGAAPGGAPAGETPSGLSILKRIGKGAEALYAMEAINIAMLNTQETLNAVKNKIATMADNQDRDRGKYSDDVEAQRAGGHGQRLEGYAQFLSDSAVWYANMKFGYQLAAIVSILGGQPGSLDPGRKPNPGKEAAMLGMLNTYRVNPVTHKMEIVNDLAEQANFMANGQNGGVNPLFTTDENGHEKGGAINYQVGEMAMQIMKYELELSKLDGNEVIRNFRRNYDQWNVLSGEFWDKIKDFAKKEMSVQERDEFQAKFDKLQEDLKRVDNEP